jgi:tRNA(Ile2) C34 agmatinyltransferase TiaS
MSKGSTQRKAQIDDDQMKSNWDRIFGKKEVEEEDEPTCHLCGGPTYVTPNGLHLQCDDCGHYVKREEMEP